MTHNLESDRESLSPRRLEFKSSRSRVDMWLSRQSPESSGRPSTSDGYDSEDYIDICFRGEQESDHLDDVVAKLRGLTAHRDGLGFGERTTTVRDDVGTTPTKLFTSESPQMMRFPRVSEGTLRADIEDYYAGLSEGLDTLLLFAGSAFLSSEFLQQSINLLATLDGDVRILLEKLAELRHPSSVEFCQSLIEYTSISRKLMEVCSALRFSTTLMKAYHSSQVEASVVALEGLVQLPKGTPRAMHVVKAEASAHCINNAMFEMVQMRKQVKEMAELGNLGSLSYFNVPNLSIVTRSDDFAESDFTKWSGLWGVLFAMKTTTSYLTQLLLAGLAYAGEGPVMNLGNKTQDSYKFRWASSLAALHIEVRKLFNRAKDNTQNSSCSFVSQDNNRLEFMIRDMKGHLQSLLDQGKFLNIGAYLGSWQADKKKMMHNVPQFRRHLILVRHHLSIFCATLESLTRDMIKGQQQLAHM